MSNPFQRAWQRVRQLFGTAPQPVYRERIGQQSVTPYTGPINMPPPPQQRQKTLYRVGLNPKSGLGQYPTKAGVAGALDHLPDERVQVRIYGAPAWDTTQHTSPPPDEQGNVYITYFASRSELETALVDSGDIQDWVSQTGSYDFERVLAVFVGSA